MLFKRDSIVSIGIINKSENPIKITISFKEDCGFFFSHGKNYMKKIINPFSCEFFFHFRIPDEQKEADYVLHYDKIK